MNKQITILIIGIIFIITILGLPLDLITPDAALYGSISKTMFKNNDFINLYSLGNDWLDKPHLPFWLSAISFNILGLSEIAYKIPAVLLFFFGCWATYKLAENLYSKEVGILAVLILTTSLHSVISNFDVRAEPYLTAFIIASVYWFYKYLKQKGITNLLLGSLFCALAIMTKGIFAAIPIAAAIGGDLIVKRKWKELRNPMWLAAFFLILLFITPELYSLYVQFDAHPEKIVFGKTNVSGIKFFFWDSQFGRFFNNGPIVKSSGGILFFVHTILWAFLPWAVLFYFAVFFKIKRNIPALKNNEEFYTLFATAVTFIIFSLSKFKLPHYTNIIFPFMAIITADFIVRLKTEYNKLQKPLTIVQYILIAVSLLLIIVLSFLMEPTFNPWFLLIAVLCAYVFWKVKKLIKNNIYKIVFLSAISFCFLYGFMITHFYPSLLNYQGGVLAAKFSNKNYTENIHLLKDTKPDFFGFEFYHKAPITRVSLKDINTYNKKIFFVNEYEMQFLKDNNVKFTIAKAFNNYRITRLNGKFLNKSTREKALNKRYFIRLQ